MKHILSYYKGTEEYRASFERQMRRYDYQHNNGKAQEAEGGAGSDPKKWRKAYTMYMAAKNAFAKEEARDHERKDAHNNSMFCLHVASGLEHLARGNDNGARKDFETAIRRYRQHTANLSDELKSTMKKVGVSIVLGGGR